MDDTPPAGVATPALRSRWPLRVFAGSLVALFLLAFGLTAGVVWSVRSERGSAWLLSLLPGVQVEGPKGSLLGDFEAQRVRIRIPGGSDTVTLQDAGWRGISVTRTGPPRWFHLTLDSLHARRVDLQIAPGKTTEPMKAPATLWLPVEIELRSLHIDALYANALGTEPVRDIEARLHLGANAGAEHRIEGLAATWDRLALAGNARIATTGPMTLVAAIGLAQQVADTLPAWRASASLGGPLAAPVLAATLRAAAITSTSGVAKAAQSLDLHATLRPFAAWPLGDLRANAQALDLSAFGSAAPATALTLQAVATSTAADRPASVKLDLTNPLAGRWDEGRLPVRSLALELAARPDQPRVLALRTLDAELGTAQVGAGHVTGTGGWSPERWNLDGVLAAVQPARLDARAPAMQLSGPLALSGDAAAAGTLTVKAGLAGTVTDRGQARAAQLRLDAVLSASRIEVRELQALAGGARASMKGAASRPAADAPWAVKAQAALVDFDPAVWWPGRDDSPWRRATNRLNVQGTVDFAVPANAAAQAPLDLLAALRGQAALHVDKSVLAGVPLAGDASLRSDGAQAHALVMLQADTNRLHAEGRLGTTGNGASDVWDLALDGPALNRLAPVFKLLQPAGADATLAGVLNANAHVTGRWPALATQGHLEASALRVGTLAVQKAQARWALGSSATALVEAQATLTQASVVQGNGAGPSLESMTLALTGTGRAHTLDLRAESRARPPAWAEAMQADGATATATSPAGAARTLAVLQAQGGLIDLPTGTRTDARTNPASALAGWRGTVSQFELRSNAAGAAPLLRTRDVALEVQWAGGTARATVQPGRAEILGAALRWSRIAWQAAGGPSRFAQVEVEADLEPLRIAPLLARVQPDFGWGGDLTVTGHLKLRSTPAFSADIVIERGSGDLTVTEESDTRALGLTDLRLGLNAENGVWSFTQGLAGRTLGVFAGAVQVRTTPEATWPPADAPIQGVLELRVAELGTWGNWVPPGWRLGGALHSSASIGGRFGAPEYTGSVEGTKLSVRNFLQGVNVGEGDVLIRLQGTSAHIERFSAKAGNGSLKVEGDASFGDAPKAQLKLSADRFQLLGRVDRRIVTSGSGQLQLDKKTLAFDGRFDVDEGLIDFTRSDAPTLSGEVEVVRARGVPSPAAAASAAAAPTPSPIAAANPSRDVALDVRVTLGEKLRVRGRGLDTGLRGELHITSPGGRLAVNGTVQAADGTYAAYGQKLAIDRGLITFTGAVENPRLDIEATRPNIDTRVGVIIGGSPANPRVRLFSEPELSEIDKLSWLVMGRASDGLGRTDTALLQRAALALLAGEGGGPTDQVTKALGLDDISVRQTDGEVRETVIALGKQLSKRWYVGYERGLNATTGSFQLIYRIAQRFTLRAQSGDENSLDLIWTWRWK